MESLDYTFDIRKEDLEIFEYPNQDIIKVVIPIRSIISDNISTEIDDLREEIDDLKEEINDLKD